MARRRRWTTGEILDTAIEVLRTSDAGSFSVRQVAAALGTDSSSLYRHFRSKTELLRAVTDRIIGTAMEGYEPKGGWRRRLTDISTRLWDAFGRHPQVAALWGRYISSGPGSRLVMEETLQALRASGLPDEEIPGEYHRLATLLVALVSSGAAAGAVPAEEHEQGLELFRVTVLGADPERFPALAHFGRAIRPVIEDRQAAFETLLAGQLDLIEAAVSRAGTGG